VSDIKILAAVMDVVFVRPWFKEFKITKIKKFLVYDPRKVAIREIDDARSKQIR